MYPSLAASRTRLGGVVGKRAKAQMRVVVDEACDDDDDGVGGGQMPWVSPQSLEKTGTLMGALSTGVPRPQKRGMVVVRVQGGWLLVYCSVIGERCKRAENGNNVFVIPVLPDRFPAMLTSVPFVAASSSYSSQGRRRSMARVSVDRTITFYFWRTLRL